jgi:putative permease
MSMNPILRWFRTLVSSPSRVILALIILGALFFVIFLGELLAPVLVAMVLAYLLDGPVKRLERLRIPRPAGTWLIFALFLAFCAVILIFLIPFLIQEVAKLARQAPDMMARFKLWVAGLPAHRPSFLSEEQYSQILKAIRANTDIIGMLQVKLSAMGDNLLAQSVKFTQGAVQTLIYAILIPLMTFFFLKDKDQILAWFTQFAPDNIGLTRRVMTEVDQQFSNYIRGRFYEILIVWVVTYTTFRLLGLNYSMLLGVFTGLSVLLPYVGATIMAIPVILLALVQPEFSSMDMAMVVLAYGVIQFLDGNILAPLLLSGVTNLHPIAIIVSFLIFGSLWGFWGVFFAIPLGALVNAVIKAWMSKQAESDDALATHPGL